MASLLDWTLDASSLRQALFQLHTSDLKTACHFKRVPYTTNKLDTVDRIVRAAMLDNANCREVLSGSRSSFLGRAPGRVSKRPFATQSGHTLHGTTSGHHSVTSPQMTNNFDRMISPESMDPSVPGLSKRVSTQRRPRMNYLSKSNRSNVFSNSNISNMRHGKERTIFSEIELDAVGLSWMAAANSNSHFRMSLRNSPAHYATHCAQKQTFKEEEVMAPSMLPSGIVPPNIGTPSSIEEIEEEHSNSEEEIHLDQILSPKSRTVGVVPWARVSMAPQYHDSGDLEEECILKNEQILEMELNKKVWNHRYRQIQSDVDFNQNGK